MTETDDYNDDRRLKKRLYGAFFVRVRGRSSDNRVVKIRTLADNISQGGLYLQMPRHLLPSGRIFTLTRLPGGAFLAAHGFIVRQENQRHGLVGIAMGFLRSRLIPAPSSN